MMRVVFDRKIATDEQWDGNILKPIRAFRKWLASHDASGEVGKKIVDFTPFGELTGTGGGRAVISGSLRVAECDLDKFLPYSRKIGATGTWYVTDPRQI